MTSQTLGKRIEAFAMKVRLWSDKTDKEKNGR